jgi:ELWxxDGT repeat protein
VLGARLFFSAFTAQHGRELWVSDGSTAGTQLAVDIAPGSASSNPAGLTTLGNKLIFSAQNASSGRELWISDGSAAGTQMLKDIVPGSLSGNPESMTRFGDRVFFVADDGVHGEELWVSDGTAAGTQLFADLVPGATGSKPAYLSPCGSRHLYFRAYDAQHGFELWRTDGTPQGTVLVEDIDPGSGSAAPQLHSDGGQKRMLVHWDELVFQIDDPIVDHELFSYHNGATSTPYGEGYAAAGSIHPTLRSDDPLLGQPLRIQGSGKASATSFAVVLAGVPALPSLRLDPVQHAFSVVDLTSFWFVAHIASLQTGDFTLQTQLPADPGLQGLRLALQSFVLPTKSPLGFDLSNGLHWTLAGR